MFGKMKHSNKKKIFENELITKKPSIAKQVTHLLLLFCKLQNIRKL